MGTNNLITYLEKYSLDLDEEFDDRLSTHSRKQWKNFVNTENKHLVSEEAVDFLDKCLLYDHVNYIQDQRITPIEAMHHPYFKPVVEMYRKLENQQDIPKASAEYYTSQILRSRSS